MKTLFSGENTLVTGSQEPTFPCECSLCEGQGFLLPVCKEDGDYRLEIPRSGWSATQLDAGSWAFVFNGIVMKIMQARDKVEVRQELEEIVGDEITCPLCEGKKGLDSENNPTPLND